MKQSILIVGGYGAVGRIIAQYLSKSFPGKIMVGGRDLQKSKQLARNLNGQVIPVQIDISTDNLDVMSDVGMVVMCIDQRDTRFLEFCIENKIHYIDITANKEFIDQAELLNTKAKINKVNVILSTGLAPGITNLLAKHGLNVFSDGKYVDINILLGLGEKHGDAAYRWIFNTINDSYMLNFKDKTIRVQSFSKSKRANLLGNRYFYTFNFSDQHTLLKTTHANCVITRMAFDSRGITSMISLLKKTGITRILSNKRIQNMALGIFKRTIMGSDVFGVKATIYKEGNEQYSSSISGYGEGKITAYVAIETVRYLYDQDIPYGVSHLHQVIADIPSFLNGLKRFDDKIEITL